jgi:hypothetical protein
VLVTTGTVDIEPVVQSLKDAGLGDVLVYDNSHGADWKVYGRYIIASVFTNTQVVYVQDDDCIVPVQAIVEAWEPGTLLCNMPPEHQAKCRKQGGISLVGFGAVFSRELINFQPYLDRYPQDELFLRECDRVFTYLNRAVTRWTDKGVTHREFASDNSRMWKERRHGTDFQEIQKRLSCL